MNALFDTLTALPALALGTVLHVGAGPGSVLAHYRTLAPAALTLVEGDPQVGAALLRQAAGQPGVTVLVQVLAEPAGSVTWHRHNLAWLNGPVDADAWRSLYPRLRCNEHLNLPATTLQAVVDGLPMAAREAAAQPGAAQSLLVLDVPGQEGRLLAGLSSELLHRFDLILLRSAGSQSPDAGEVGSQALAALQAQCYHVVASGDDAEPLWPVVLLRLDRAAVETRSLRARLVALESHCAQQQEALAAAQAREAVATRQAAELERVALARADLAAQLDASRQLASQADVRCRLLADETAALQARLAALETDRAEIEKKALWRASQIELLSRSRDEQLKALSQSAQALAEQQQARQSADEARQQLATDLAQAARQQRSLEARLADLQSQVDRQSHERTQLVEQLAAAAAQQASVQSEAAAAGQAHAAAEQALRDELARLAEALKSEREALADGAGALAAQQRARQVAEEAARRLQADLVQATQRQAQQADQVLALQARVDGLALAHAQQGHTLEASNTQLVAARDQAQAAAQAWLETEQALRAQLTEAAGRHQDVEQAASEQAEQVHRLRADLDEAVAHLSAQAATHAAELAAAQAAQAALQAELQAQRSAHDGLVQERDQIAQKASWRAGQVTELSRLRDENARVMAQQVARLDALGGELATLGQALQAREQQLADLEVERAGLRDERDAAVTAQAATQAQLAAARADLAQAALDCQTRDEQHAALAAAKLEIEGKAKWRASQIELLSQERDRLRREGEGLAAQVSQLQQAALDQQQRLDAALQAAQRSEQEAQAAAARLAGEMAQLQLRQKLLDDEMLMAEGQIELIKDVLLREPGL